VNNKPDKMRIEYEPLGSVVKWPRNPKRHRIDIIDNSIDRFGYCQPLLVDEATGKLVAGHGRLETLAQKKAAGEDPPKRITVRKSDGEWMVPVIRGVAFANEREAEAYVLADNKATEEGGWDNVLLAQILQDVKLEADGLLGTGFTSAEAQAMARLLMQPQDVEFPEFQEGAGDAALADGRVRMVKCPKCQHQFPA
jgi:hypothetical protein